MKNFELNQPVGNLKTDKVGKIASAFFKAHSGDFNGFVVLTDRYGYEVWDAAFTIQLPPDFPPRSATPTA
jgi:hypothetical protein